jgi:hypothetical protein
MRKLINKLRLFRGQVFIARQEQEFPTIKRTVRVTSKGSSILTDWFYNLPGCPDSGGYTSLEMIEGKLYAHSRCESDHPGPAPKDMLYVDGIPLDRNENRHVREGAEIVIFENVRGDWTPIRLTPSFA